MVPLKRNRFVPGRPPTYSMLYCQERRQWMSTRFGSNYWGLTPGLKLGVELSGALRPTASPSM